MAVYQEREKSLGFGGMLRLLLLRPGFFFRETVARDKFPFLAFSAWLAGLAHAFQWLDRFLLQQGGLIANRFSSFALLMLLGLAMMGFIYLIGGVLFHFYAYLADSRKDMKNSLAVSVYAWIPFVIAVLIIKVMAVILLGKEYLHPPANWWFAIPSMILLGLAILYGWFLGVYGAIVGLGCKKIRAVLMLVIVPILWGGVIFVIVRQVT